MTNRQSPRIVLGARVDLRPLGSVLAEPRHSANLSKTGMFVCSSEPYPPGTLLQFALHLGRRDVVLGLAEVVWVRDQEGGPSEPRGMGLRFRFLEAKGAALLHNYIRTYLEIAGVEDPEDTKEIPAWQLSQATQDVCAAPQAMQEIRAAAS